MSANKKSNTNRIQTTLALVSARVLPVVVNNFRNKLIGVVLAGLVLPQMAYAGHGGGGGGGNKGGGGHHSGGNSSARSMQRSSNSNNSNNSNKSYSQKSSSFQNGTQKQFAKKNFGQPIPAKNGNTGINGSGLPDRVVPFKNGNTGYSGIGKPQGSQTTQSFVNKNFNGKNNNSTLSRSLGKYGKDKGGNTSGVDSQVKSGNIRTLGPKTTLSGADKYGDAMAAKKTGPLSKDVLTQDLGGVFAKKPSSPTGPTFPGDPILGGKDKSGGFDAPKKDTGILTGPYGGGVKTDPKPAPTNPGQGGGQGGGMGQGGGGNGQGGGNGNGNGQGGGKHHHHHGFPWWALITPQVVNYPSCPQVIYQQPVPVYVESPVIVTEPQVAPTYPAPTQPAPSQPANGQPVNGQPVKGNSDGYVDLVLEDVGFLEPATVTVGPLYMVKVRNQGTKASDKFRVGAFAQLEGELSDDAPRSVTEVTSLGAGELASVTLRLPASAMKLISTSSAGSAAFDQLLVVVDLDDVVTEIEKSNNVANLDRAALETAAATH